MSIIAAYVCPGWDGLAVRGEQVLPGRATARPAACFTYFQASVGRWPSVAHPPVLNSLLEAGISPIQRSPSGKTATDAARDSTRQQRGIFRQSLDTIPEACQGMVNVQGEFLSRRRRTRCPG